MKHLFGTMRRDRIRKCHLQPASALAVFVPWLDLFRLEARQHEEKRGVEIIPDRVAAEIGEMQIVPGRLNCVPLERKRADLPGS
jgi:hypothetical protein